MTLQAKKLAEREAQWRIAREIDEIKGEEGWGIKDLCYAFQRSSQYCQITIKEWEAAGYVKLSHKRGPRKYYRIVQSKKGEPTVKDRYGKIIRETSPQQNMWRSMRGLSPHPFDCLDIWRHSNTPKTPVSKEQAHAYCRMLANAGYLKVIQKANGRGKLARYKLINNSGPLPPRERRVRGVWDDNDGRFIYVAGEERA